MSANCRYVELVTSALKPKEKSYQAYLHSWFGVYLSKGFEKPATECSTDILYVRVVIPASIIINPLARDMSRYSKVLRSRGQ